MTSSVQAQQRPPRAFSHEALLYAGDDDFVRRTAPFVEEGVRAGEPVLVVVAAAKIDRLRERLGDLAGAVRFADMAGIGLNPARIIPAWHDFVAESCAPDRPVRGIGEPIWKGRGADELVEAQRHEALLNVAFADAPAWRLLCPYDTRALDAAVIEEALRTHPLVDEGAELLESSTYMGLGAAGAPFGAPLGAAPPACVRVDVDADSLERLRGLVARTAARVGMTASRIADLLLAVNEVATNSLRHAGGAATACVWHQAPDAVVCEIADAGHLDVPLAGRERPRNGHGGGRGLWLVTQLCDLVQIRSSDAGTVVRLHMRAAGG